MILYRLDGWHVFSPEIVAEQFCVPGNVAIMIVIGRQNSFRSVLVVAFIQCFQNGRPGCISLDVKRQRSAWCGAGTYAVNGSPKIAQGGITTTYLVQPGGDCLIQMAT